MGMVEANNAAINRALRAEDRAGVLERNVNHLSARLEEVYAERDRYREALVELKALMDARIAGVAPGGPGYGQMSHYIRSVLNG